VLANCCPVLFCMQRHWLYDFYIDGILLYRYLSFLLFFHVGTSLLPGDLTPKAESPFSPSRVKYVILSL
jgi:hypothetical protein